MKISLKFVLLLAVLIPAFGCEKSEEPTKPPANVLPDTTSHDFTWQIDVLGDGEASYLRDVSIIDENNVWTVGEIYLKDTTGQFMYPPYNAVKWDGTRWNLVQIPTLTYDGRTVITGLTSVFAFDPHDIWVSSDAGAIGKWNGFNWTSRWIAKRSGGITRMWGSSSNNFFLVGTNGSITYYYGTTWQKLESGTNQDIQDIWGAKDPVTGEYAILAVASSIFTSYEKEILQIKGTRSE